MDGKYGILNLRNASSSGGVSMQGGNSKENRTSITLVEDTSFIQMFSVNTEGQMEFGIRHDKSYLNMTNGTIDLQDGESAASYIKIDKDEFGGRFTLDNFDNKSLFKLSTGVNGEYGSFQLLGANGSQNILATSTSISDNHGYFSILNDLGEAKVDALAAPLGQGVIQLWGANGNANIRMTSLDGAPNRPLLSIHNTAGVESSIR